MACPRWWLRWMPVIAALQQIVQAVATATTAIGNVVNQAQPKV